jgi:hypothetical protein
MNVGIFNREGFDKPVLSMIEGLSLSGVGSLFRVEGSAHPELVEGFLAIFRQPLSEGAVSS